MKFGVTIRMIISIEGITGILLSDWCANKLFMRTNVVLS